MRKKTIKIAGAGISGCTAAIALARAGFDVEMHEQNSKIVVRFQGDFQGIENWSKGGDVLEEIKSYGIDINFDNTPYYKFMATGPKREIVKLKSEKPFFYLVKRGYMGDTLDTGLINQLKGKNNIKVIYNSRVNNIKDFNIIATGPVLNDPAVDGFVAGYKSYADSPDFGLAFFDDELAKDGYSYAFVHNGYGIIASCVMKDIKNIEKYLDRTVEAFKKVMPINMKNIKRFNGTGNLFLSNKKNINYRYVGEAGGFQDYIWGFGMRLAFKTGHIAAKSIIENTSYNVLVKKEVLPIIKNSIAMRLLYAMLGKRSYEILLKKLRNMNEPITVLKMLYSKSLVNTLLFPLARVIYCKHLVDSRGRFEK